jgi:hypothetical protein
VVKIYVTARKRNMLLEDKWQQEFQAIARKQVSEHIQMK